MWVHLAAQMRGRWDAQRHEDRYSVGIPDLSFALGGVDGWLELKTIPAWPIRKATKVRVRHLTPEQVNWLGRREAAGFGAVFLLLAVGESPASSEWFLLSASDARRLYDCKLTRDDIVETSLMHWRPGSKVILSDVLVDSINLKGISS